MISKTLFLTAIALGASSFLGAQTCPTTEFTNTDCAFILTIAPGGTATIAPVSGSPNAYDDGGGSLVGVVNNSGATFTGTITLAGAEALPIFNFNDGGGICNSLDSTPGYCEGAATGYEGPMVTFSNISSSIHCDGICNDVGTVNIAGLPAGSVTYFALNGEPFRIVDGGGINVLGVTNGNAPVCPTVQGATNTNCAFILTVNNSGATITPVSNANPYDSSNANGALVGVINNTGRVFSGSFSMSGSFVAQTDSDNPNAGIFDFTAQSQSLSENDAYDGICNYAYQQYCGNESNNFYGYEGPQISFSGLNQDCEGTCGTTGTVNIASLPPNATTYFSLQGSPAGITANGGITLGSGGANEGSGTVCPPVAEFTNTDCAFVITIGTGGAISVAPVNGANSYNDGDSSLVGIVNNSGAPFNGSFVMTGVFSDGSGPDGVFDLDDYSSDGICNYVFLPYCPIASISSFSRSQGAFEGPLVTYSNVTSTQGGDCYSCQGTVNVNNLPAGSATYFSIEGIPSDITNNGGLTIGSLSQPPPTSGPLTFNSIDLGTVPYGRPINVALSASGGTPPYSFSASGTPPAGITVNGGTVTGTPSAPGGYNIGAQVTDSTGASSGGTVTVSFFGFASNSLPAGIISSPYLVAVGVNGGTPPYTFSISGLPKGLSATTSGTIQGTVTSAVTSQVSITATEFGGVSVSQSDTLTFGVPPALSVPSQTLPPGQISTNYSQALSATGGAPPYSWSIATGSLPSGLNLQPTGVVAGNPSQSGTFSLGVRATDVTGASAIGSAVLTIAAAPVTVTAGPTSSNASGSASLSASLANAVATVEYPPQVISATGGVAPYTFTLTGGTLPPGVSLASSGLLGGTPTSSGSYTFTVTATDSSTGIPTSGNPAARLSPLATSATGATGSATFTVAVSPFSTNLLLSTSGLAWSLIAGTTAAPPAQVVSVQSTTTAAAINYSVSVTPSTATWLTVTPAAGSTPSTVNVSLNNQALALTTSPTPYQATVAVTCLSPAPCAGSSQQVAVNVSVTSPPPQLSVQNNLISFTSSPGATGTMTQSLSVQNTGGGTIGFASISCAASWCTVGAAPGSIAPGPAVNIPVTVDPTSLNPGFYRTTITIKASTGVAIVPVTLFVATAYSMNLAPAGVLYQSVAGGVPNGPGNTYLLDCNSSTPVAWNAAVVSGGTWLSVVNSSGMTSAAQPGNISFAIDPGVAAGLAPQVYYGTIRVSVPGLVNSPQDFQVVLNIAAANAQQRPSPSPAGLLFISTSGAVPPPQNITVSTDSVSSAAFQVSANTSDGASWLSATPAFGSAAPGSPGTTQVSVNPGVLSPGVYYGGVNFAFAGAAVRTTNVTLIVPNTTAAHDVSNATSACTPTQLVPAQTGLVSNFAAPVAWPVPISIQLLNDCATPVTNGQIVATFSNGDAPLPLTLANSTTGLYSATWTPAHASSQVTINARASAPGLPNVTALLAGSVTPNAAPLLAPNSTLNIFNPLPGAALAPGTLVQISGTALAGLTNMATAPLPTILSGTQVVVGGVQAPLSSVSPGLLTAQIPFELAPAMQYQVIVNANGALTTPATIQLSGTSPGVSASTAGLLLASHLNGTAVTEAAPAAPGEYLVLLATGLGATSPPVADGVAGPSSPPLANVTDMPTVTINNEPTTILFAGLQPGVVGVYQINIQVPSDAASGDLSLVLSQDGNPANSTFLPVKKGS